MQQARGHTLGQGHERNGTCQGSHDAADQMSDRTTRWEAERNRVGIEQRHLQIGDGHPIGQQLEPCRWKHSHGPATNGENSKKYKTSEEAVRRLHRAMDDQKKKNKK